MIDHKLIQYFKKRSPEDLEIAFYDASKKNNYFESFHPLVIEDSFEGVIVCLEDVLIKKNAKFSGELICKSCLIEGTLEGDILATDYIRILKNAFLNATILSASIFIETHATATGDLRISKEINTPDAFKKLEHLYKSSLTILHPDIEPEKIKKIILREGSVKALSKVPGEIPPNDFEKKEIETSVSQIPFEEAELSATVKASEPTDSAWW
jgi:cytoskeletal protein CcmA (bactofilin family)